MPARKTATAARPRAKAAPAPTEAKVGEVLFSALGETFTLYYGAAALLGMEKRLGSLSAVLGTFVGDMSVSKTQEAIVGGLSTQSAAYQAAAIAGRAGEGDALG